MVFLKPSLSLLLKVTEVINEQQKLRKISTNSVKSLKGKSLGQGRSPPQELKVSPHSGLYLLVEFKRRSKIFENWE